MVCAFSFFWRSHFQSYTPQQSLITNFWPGAPTNIDAAFESRELDSVLLFKGTALAFSMNLYLMHLERIKSFKSSFSFLLGRQVWAYRGYDLAAGYPRSISAFGLPKKTKKINAAAFDERTGKILFFVDDYYYRCVLLFNLI